MKHFYIHLLETVVLSVLVVCIALGGGYQLNEQGARAVGMGGAFVARASDPSAIYFNPAGLANQTGINLLGGINLIMPSTTFEGYGAISYLEQKTKSQVFTPVNVYGTFQINDKIVVGLGVFNPFGLGTEWPELWGKNNVSGLYMGSMQMGGTKSDLQVWYFNPSVGYKINDKISVGLGVSYVYGSATIKQKTPIGGGNYGNVSLEGTGSGINVNFGVIYKPVDKLSIGLSYRINTDIEFDGDFKTPAASIKGKATLPMPGNLYFGVAYDVLPKLTLEADIQYIQWGVYKNLTLKLTPGGTQAPNVKNWNDGIIFRGGAEYILDPKITLRGGLILDLSPQPPSKTEPMLPDGDRIDICLGGSYKINEKFSVDAAYMLVLFMERDAKENTSLKGTYNTTAHIISVNLGYHF